LGWREPSGDQDDWPINALNSILTEGPEPSEQSSFQVEKVVGLFAEDWVVESLETPRQVKDRFCGRVGGIIEVVSDAIQYGPTQSRVSEEAQMERKDLGGFGAQVNFDPVTILFEFAGNMLEGILNSQAFTINLLFLNRLSFHTLPKIADHHGLTNSETWGHRNGWELQHSRILVG
jgi:hypothetical protein